MRLTIDEYSKKYKMSKEMISSKIRAKSIEYIIEDENLYIIVPDEIKKPQLPTKQKMTVSTIIALYQKENRQLKEKIIELEAKIDKLIDDKEQMLRAERDRIEQVYSSKDEQLKNILELINTKLMIEQQQAKHPALEVKPIEKTNSSYDEPPKIFELKEYLKTLNLKSNQRKQIKQNFLNVYDSDVRIIKKDGKLYLDFSKYDYSDLLEY